VSLLLGGTETPPIPVEVADRIDAALAAESAATAVPATPQLAPTAPPNRRAESSGPGRPRQVRRSRRRLGRILLATAVFAAGLVTTTMLILQPDSVRSGTSSAAAGAAAAVPSAAPVPAGPEFSADQLPAEVHRLLAGQSERPRADSMTEQSAGTPSCVTTATGRTDAPPLATGSGRYQGKPVTLLAYRADDGTATLDVYLVTPACPGATVLLHRTIPA
jgi:hypothetical protein